MLMVDTAELTQLVTVADSLVAAREAAEAAASGAAGTSGRLTTGRLQVDWNSESGSRILFAAVPSLKLFGYKQFHWIGSGVRYSCHLFDISDGTPLGVVDAAKLTTLRTAGTAAVGVERLYGSGRAAVVAVIGTGAEAKAGLRALAQVVDITEVRVTSRRAANRDAFAAQLGTELDIVVVPVETIREATAGADIVYSATQSNGSVVYGVDDLDGVSVLATIGSTSPDQREASGDVFARASVVIVDTMDAIDESGDLVEAREEFGFAPADARLLGDLLVDDRQLDTGAGGLAVFKSIGSPEQDLVLAHHVLRRAHEAGLGTLVAPATSLKQNL